MAETAIVDNEDHFHVSEKLTKRILRRMYFHKLGESPTRAYSNTRINTSWENFSNDLNSKLERVVGEYIAWDYEKKPREIVFSRDGSYETAYIALTRNYKEFIPNNLIRLALAKEIHNEFANQVELNGYFRDWGEIEIRESETIPGGRDLVLIIEDYDKL